MDGRWVEYLRAAGGLAAKVDIPLARDQDRVRVRRRQVRLRCGRRHPRPRDVPRAEGLHPLRPSRRGLRREEHLPRGLLRVKVLIVGDCHGESGMYAAARLARDIGADAVIQLGDAWSVNLPNLDTPPFHVVRGNHELWQLWA